MKARTVRDAMLSLDEYATIPEDRTLRDALVALDQAQLGLDDDRHHHRAVLVLDAKGQVVGKLTHWAVLRSLEPRLLKKSDLRSLDRAGLSTQFIQSMVAGLPVPDDSFAGLCDQSSRILVRDVMVPARESIEAAAPLSEAIRLLVVSHVQSMLVIEEGQAVGILRLCDVFEEVAKAIRAGPE